MSQSSISYSADLIKRQGCLESTFVNSKTWAWIAPEEVEGTGRYVHVKKKSREGLRVIRSALALTQTLQEARVLSWIVWRLAQVSKKRDWYASSYAQISRRLQIDKRTAKRIVGALIADGFIVAGRSRGPRKFTSNSLMLEAGARLNEVHESRTRCIYVTQWMHEICDKDAGMSLLLSQLCWLSKRSGGVVRDGTHWIINSWSHLVKHTGMTQDALRAALVRLQGKNFVKVALYPYSTKYAGGRNVMHLSINASVLDELVCFASSASIAETSVNTGVT